MELGAAGLSVQPFPTHGKPLSVVSYAAQTAAIEMLADTCAHPTAISLLQGPSLSGKSTIIKTFVHSIPDHCIVVVVDGKDLGVKELLGSVVKAFGYDLDLSSANELFAFVRVVASQQSASGEAPMLIVENAHELSPGTAQVLCKLADLRVGPNSALKLVLASDRSLKSMLSLDSMKLLAKRVVHDFHLRPMDDDETRFFLHSKLKAAGLERPETLFPEVVCQDIWRASGGWPGIADRVALLALAQAKEPPIASSDIEHAALPPSTQQLPDDPETMVELSELTDPPRLVVTNNGSVMDRVTMDKGRMLFGRSEHNDVSIKSRFISRHHLLLVRHGPSTILMDLNSSNGTFVNSRRVSNHVMVHNDIVTVGHHRIKFYDPYATPGRILEDPQIDDTIIMKTLQDMRKLLAQENTSLIPTLSENLPTIQT